MKSLNCKTGLLQVVVTSESKISFFHCPMLKSVVLDSTISDAILEALETWNMYMR